MEISWKVGVMKLNKFDEIEVFSQMRLYVNFIAAGPVSIKSL